MTLSRRPLAPTPCLLSGDIFAKLQACDDDAQTDDGDEAAIRSFEDIFIDAVNEAGICPDLALLNTTSKVVTEYIYDRTPNISVCRKASYADALQTKTTGSANAASSPRPTPPTRKKIPMKSSSAGHWSRIELCIESMQHMQGPFSDPPPTKAHERATYAFEETALEARGRDLSVTSASEEETELAQKHSMDGDIHKIQVTNDADKVDHYFLVSAPPCTGLWSLGGRRSVRNIAPLVCGGDVAGQMTVTQNFAGAAWRSGKLPHQHNWLALGIIGRPLKDFKSTKEMVRAVYHAFIAHWDAYSLADVLHCDISGGNILIVDDGDTTRGILIDWDLSKKTKKVRAEARSNWWIGTWQFISAAILRNRFKVHEYQDDMESFLHVVTYHSLRYRPYPLISYHSGMHEMFEAAQECHVDDAILGGQGKCEVVVAIQRFSEPRVLIHEKERMV
ncbi:hypothetical protein EVG20_g3282 [Dentipellis fragilis]|uniref:Fungal-type protein kinase domain-containing protein n=1 Tax=Dentipellis fragilis TaxID=205917 RepID=A0A4Y9Z3J0_9AGAM|nr:hypothetical protein EVG20_g3282 [Dentipellis fragilis]